MLQTIYWILAILVMIVLLFVNIYCLISAIKADNRIKELQSAHLEYLDKQIQLLESREK